MPFRAAAFLRFLRKCHAWVGLSGAAFGLLFGLTGFLLNHRGTWKIEAGKVEEQKVQLELSAPPATPEALLKDLAQRLGFPEDRARIRLQAPRSTKVAGQDARVPAQWTLAFFGHKRFATATYIPGNRSVEVERKEADALALLKRLHMGSGGQLGWILVADAVAFGTLFLTLSGILLWTRLAGSRLLAAGLAAGGLVTGLLVMLRGL